MLNLQSDRMPWRRFSWVDPKPDKGMENGMQSLQEDFGVGEEFFYLGFEDAVEEWWLSSAEAEAVNKLLIGEKYTREDGSYITRIA